MLIKSQNNISASECQNFLIIDNFMEAAIDWISTNQNISDTLPGAALWRHMDSHSEVVFHSGGSFEAGQAGGSLCVYDNHNTPVHDKSRTWFIRKGGYP